LPTQRTERPDVRDFQAGTIHQMYGPAHEELDSTSPDLRAIRGLPHPFVIFKGWATCPSTASTGHPARQIRGVGRARPN
jgi:hypothetical protein